MIENKKQYTVAWFSAGVSSAIATKLMIDEIDQIIYTHIDDQHDDSLRFVRECEEWFGKKILITQSRYKTVESVAKSVRFISGPHGAACTRLLKVRVRQEWEADNIDKGRMRYVWGMDESTREKKRAKGRMSLMPEFDHVFPLIQRGITKAEAHQMFFSTGIKRPAMYDLGYSNNNCVGCLKGGMAYWNKIRIDFPEVFAARAKLEREVGASCINGTFLDELDPSAGRGQEPIVEDCGIFCEIYAEQLGRNH